MSEYLVKSKLEDTEWQIANQAREHEFICDDNDKEHDKALTRSNIYVVA